MLQAKIAPSMMCVNAWSDAPGALKELNALGIDFFHMDLMDGHFVPNLALGTDSVRQLRQKARVPLDLHLMVEHPEDMLSWLEIRPGELVSIHTESTRHLQRVLSEIRARGARPVAALNPATPLQVLDEVLDDIDGVLLMTVNPGFAGQTLVPQTVEKIARLRALLDARGHTQTEIEVDGNVSFANAAKMRAAGANIFVAGTSSIFAGGDTLAGNLQTLRRSIEAGGQ